MTNLETEICITVFADHDYNYEVVIGELNEIRYFETSNGTRTLAASIGFGSLQEMETLAKAIMSATKTATELRKQ